MSLKLKSVSQPDYEDAVCRVKMNLVRALVVFLLLLCSSDLNEARRRRRRPYQRPYSRYDHHDHYSWLRNSPMYSQAFHDFVNSYKPKFPEQPPLTPKPTFPPHPAGYYQTLQDYPMQMPLQHNPMNNGYSQKPFPYSDYNNLMAQNIMTQHWQQLQQQQMQQQLQQNHQSYTSDDAYPDQNQALDSYVDSQVDGDPPKYLLPLFMLGVGLPALGFMYLMMNGAGRSLQTSGGLQTELIKKVQKSLDYYMRMNKKLKK